MPSKNELPHNTVTRLCQYRRLLSKYKYLEEPYIFSHDLARMLGFKPVQVRHDMMLLGMTGDKRKGYSVTLLLQRISDRIDMPDSGVILIGLGALGMSLLRYFKASDSNLEITAAFDIDPSRINKTYEDIPCFSIAELPDYIKKYHTKIVILTLPSDDVNDVLSISIDAGIKGILNYTAEQLNVPANLIVKNIDMINYLEEIAYFVNQPKKDM